MTHDELVLAVDKNPFFVADMIFIDKNTGKEYEVNYFTDTVVNKRETLKVFIKEVKKKGEINNDTRNRLR